MESIIGKRFGRLTVLRPLVGFEKNKKYECECDCGNLAYISRTSLLSGATKSCRCLGAEESKKRSTIVGEENYISIVLEYINSPKTFAEIGKQYNCTRERIRQIVKDFGEKEAKILKKSIIKFNNKDEDKRKKLKKIREKNSKKFFFWKNVEAKEDFRECWNWTGNIYEEGYGVANLRIFGKNQRGAHRVSWIFNYGNPGDSFVLHKCDNPRCCNPKHLYLGDAKNNAEDRTVRKRSNYRALTHEEKLSISCLQVESKEQIVGLMKKYNVTSATIRRHISGRYETRFRNGDPIRYGVQDG